MTIYVFSQLIINWYHINGRKHLPWQKNKTLYRIWISEIMLQQTAVQTVIPYFNKFISKFPNIDTLIAGQLDDILYLWSGLGYYSRAMNIYKSAKIIQNIHQSKFPDQFSDIIQLPGIGKTTAGAILSLSKNFFFPILDGNVKRILMRYHGIQNDITKSQIEKKLWKIIELTTPIHNTNKFNQSMMDIGSLICKSTLPQCHICPLNKKCVALQEKKWNKYSFNRNIKIKIKKISWFVLIKYHDNIWLEKNTTKNIWKNLFCFPSFTTKIKALKWAKDKQIHVIQHEIMADFIHIFSHFTLHIYPILITLIHKKNFFYTKNGIWYNLKKPQKIGIPHPIQKILYTFSKNITI